jgi:tetratricopeptide (TPR) repeat protein
MIARTLLLAALLLQAAAAQACINYIGTDHQGHPFSPDWIVGEELTEHLTEQPWRRMQLERAKEVIADARATPTFDRLNNLGVLLIYQGQYPIAIRHFLMIERTTPGRYETAANLGTALELAGHDKVALRWIRIGMRRNNDAHLQSEWLHARILESKSALAQDPDCLARRSVAGVSFGNALVPPMPAMPAGNDGEPVSPAMLQSSMSYQLFERTQFVKPRDPIVANVLRDWATLHLVGGSIENADTLYELAVTYGAPHDDLMKRRQAHIRTVLANARKDGQETGQCAICGTGP